jgi:hypothetical protein
MITRLSGLIGRLVAPSLSRRSRLLPVMNTATLANIMDGRMGPVLPNPLATLARSIVFPCKEVA